ncbi:hypothetical protein G9A89_015725 [Geosiphon pyriformis]|nr:hypothetical protein G9A89_015725 [Geosiphon pyriformis]
MHPRNRYKNKPPDFSVLAYKYISFHPYVQYKKNGKAYIDFKNPKALRELTYCLLRDDFHLELDMPPDTLCPMIPNRLNYIHWIEDLLSCSDTRLDEVYGIDIGTGASCIYPLLGCTLNKNWKFIATDINKRLVKYAEANIIRNDLRDRVTMVLKTKESKLLLDEQLEQITSSKRFSFCMCNPPFYESQEQYEEALNSKEAEPSGILTATRGEIITIGGELNFIKRILQESLILKDKIGWYTSMMGRKETVNLIVAELKKNKIDNFAVTEFSQGQTRRWGVGWSFRGYRLPTNISQPSSKRLRKVGPPITEFFIEFFVGLQSVIEFLEWLFSDLNIEARWNEEIKTFMGIVYSNTWSRSSRRKHEREKEKAQQATAQPLNQQNVTSKIASSLNSFIQSLFEFSCHLEALEYTTKITFSWKKGLDRSLFESFFLHVKNRLERKFRDSVNEVF